MKNLALAGLLALTFIGCDVVNLADFNDPRDPLSQTSGQQSIFAAKDITEFTVPNSTNTVISADGGTTGTIELTVPVGTYVYSLVPTFKLAGKSSAKVGTVAQTSGSSVHDFSSPVSYLVTAEDGSTKTYTVSVRTPPVLYELAMIASNAGAAFPVKIDSTSGAITALTQPASWGSSGQFIFGADLGGRFVAAGNLNGTLYQFGATTLRTAGTYTDLGSMPGPAAGPNNSVPVFTPDASSLFFWQMNTGSVTGFATSASTQASSWAKSVTTVPNFINSFIVGPTGKTAYVLNAMNATPSINTYSIGAGGALSSIASQGTGSINTPVAQILDPRGTHLYVLDAFGNLEMLTVNEGTLGSASGQPLSFPSALAAPSWNPFTASSPLFPLAMAPSLIMDPNGKFLYVIGSANAGSTHNLLETYQLDQNTGTATYKSAVDRGAVMMSNVSVNKSGTKGFIFYSPAAMSHVDVFDIDQNGAWNLLRTWNSTVGNQIAVDPSGTWVVAASVTGGGPPYSLSVQTWNTNTGIAGSATSVGSVSTLTYAVAFVGEVAH